MRDGRQPRNQGGARLVSCSCRRDCLYIINIYINIEERIRWEMLFTTN